MLLHVQYFGRLQDLTQCAQSPIDLPEPCTVATLLEQVQKDYPPLAEAAFQVAVNRRLASTNQVIEAGDEVALLPPFSGG